MSQETIQETFQAPSPARVTVTNIRGSVQILAWEANVVEVTAIKHTDSGDPRSTVIELSQGEDGRIAIQTHFQKGRWQLPARKPCKVDYQIRTPRACDVNLSCVSSAASLSGLEGTFELQSVSGNLRVEGLSGALKVHSVSGDLIGSKITGELHLDTVSGDVSLSDSRLVSIDGSTVSGNFDLHTPIAARSNLLNSVSGDIKLILPAEAGLTVHTKSLSGEFSTNLPITSDRRSGRSYTAQLAGGGPEIKFHSMSGDLWVGTKAAAEHDGPKAMAERRPSLDILAGIERGELSVEEGLKELGGQQINLYGSGYPGTSGVDFL